MTAPVLIMDSLLGNPPSLPTKDSNEPRRNLSLPAVAPLVGPRHIVKCYYLLDC